MKRGKLRHAIFAVVYSENPQQVLHSSCNQTESRSSLKKNQTDNKIEYLILKRKKHWVGWEFPKGKIEFLETKKMAVKREIKEETGLKILNIEKFDVKGLYKYKKKMKDRPGFIGQTYHLFAVQVEMGNVKIDQREHSGFKWMKSDKAKKMITWEIQKKCLGIVDDWIRNH